MARRRARLVWSAAALLMAAGLNVAAAGQERGPTPIQPEQLDAAIDHLGDVDYPARVAAGRTVRRTPPAQAVPALVRSVDAHGDGYVKFRALVILTGFNDPRIAEAVNAALGSPNDRLREVAFAYLEQHPDPALVPRLLKTFETEQGDFVRPAMIRAMAAIGHDPRVQPALLRDINRGVDYFRGSVIEALGDYKHAWAVPAIIEVAKLEGPLQDDAVLALGKIGDRRALPVLAELQRTASRESQPAVAAAICLLGSNCSSHMGYLQKVLGFADDNPGYQELLRSASSGLAAIAARGNADALTMLLDAGVPSNDPLRAPLALAVALVGLRNTPLLLQTLEARKDRDGAVSLLAEGFDMLEEDFEEERFFATVRRTYWSAADKSATRQLCERLITTLDF